MRNFVMTGCTLTVLAVVAVKSGDLVVSGGVFGVASTDAVIGQEVEVKVGGVYDLPKVGTEAWTFGQALYWDATAKKVTTTASTNLKIGVAVRPAGELLASALGRVRLNDTF